MLWRKSLSNPYFCLVFVRVFVSCYSSTMSSKPHPNSPLLRVLITRRLLDVPGFDGRENDVIFCGKAELPAKQNVVFFGGDVQDYPEAMAASRDNHRYMEWNLEATAQLMAARFPDSHVWLIHPKEMHYKTFAVFSNFLEFTDLANPLYSKDYNSWTHLKDILAAACQRMSNPDTGAEEPSQNEDACEEDQKLLSFVASPELPLTVIGFSKGCVVLNQLLHELEAAKFKPGLTGILRNVRAMFWLDSGHNGGKDIFVTQENVLQHLQDTDIYVHVHVTPYQINDTMRPFIKAEYKRFVDRLRKLKLPVTNIRHFEDEERNIDAHFGILKSFKD